MVDVVVAFHSSFRWVVDVEAGAPAAGRGAVVDLVAGVVDSAALVAVEDSRVAGVDHRGNYNDIASRGSSHASRCRGVRSAARYLRERNGAPRAASRQRAPRATSCE